MLTDSGQTALAIGEKLRAARQRAKMSLRELAAKADTSASMLSQIENGKAYPSVRSLYNIAAALDLPVDYFFPNDGRPSEELVEMTASELREAHLQAATPASQADVKAKPGGTATPIVHPHTRPTIVLKGGITWSRLTAHAEEHAEFLEIVYAPGATSGASMSHHAGREFGLILEGELILELAFERYLLKEGDSIIFDSTTPHRLTNASNKPMRALWVVLS